MNSPRSIKYSPAALSAIKVITERSGKPKAQALSEALVALASGKQSITAKFNTLAVEDILHYRAEISEANSQDKKLVNSIVRLAKVPNKDVAATLTKIIEAIKTRIEKRDELDDALLASARLAGAISRIEDAQTLECLPYALASLIAQVEDKTTKEGLQLLFDAFQP